MRLRQVEHLMVVEVMGRSSSQIGRQDAAHTGHHAADVNKMLLFDRTNNKDILYNELPDPTWYISLDLE